MSDTQKLLYVPLYIAVASGSAPRQRVRGAVFLRVHRIVVCPRRAWTGAVTGDSGPHGRRVALVGALQAGGVVFDWREARNAELASGGEK